MDYANIFLKKWGGLMQRAETKRRLHLTAGYDNMLLKSVKNYIFCSRKMLTLTFFAL